ncbi:MAG: thioredoxin family protein [Myxococcota bacterium]
MGPLRTVGFVAVAVLCTAVAPVRAAPEVEPLPVRGELTFESGAAPRVGVRLAIDPGWHIYGAEVGEVGLPTRLAWHVDGASVGPTAYPATVEFADAEAGITSTGYAGSVMLASPVRLSAWTAAERMARVDVRFLACRQVCIPGRLALERDLGPLLASSAGNAGRAAEPSLSLARVLLLALAGGLLLNLMPCVLPVLALKAFALADLAGKGRHEVLAHGAGYVAGVLVSMLALAAVVIGLREAGTAVGWGFQFQEPAYSLAIAALLVVLALNLFGVFEVAAPAGLAYVGANASGATRSLFDGLLAVALATPCSAPFLGTAVGFAFASDAPVTLAVFAALGLGLALPLALVALIPGSARFLPRSGAWMGQLRVVLGFALLASAAWLLWIFGRLAGSDALAAALGWLVALAFATWIFGALQAAERSGRGFVLASSLVLAALLGLRPLSQADAAESGATGRAEASAPRYSAEAVSAHLRAGRPVFAEFTADWCLTCKANERLVLHSDRVRAALARRDFAVLKADWTRRDEAIRAELARFGKAGVPLYVLWFPDAPDAPRVLPELITIDGLVEALSEERADAA